ncbi:MULTISPECIES: dienelactone hydrolase family protein [unclassified Massilia]|uniref:dienelactone hydrolase family protein n=1 Tax=unclassified Massilia TaxID=2609279 RepID=UPI0017814F1F|nr:MULTISPECIES: dienelactone hydrolase family protein [unclassified Massilia]MBD8530703.1 dienelactone hydrolase family protein [Massilia sp. CFBP 13647]MBD8674928.1 dienelactone hydrolase family protein [Massilia sp. CFBP 13721]
MKDLVQDGDSLVGTSNFEEGVDRRVFLKAAIGTGFAAATLPVAAQTVVKTDVTGLSAGDHIIVINGQDVPVYRAQPEGKANPPVILVISEIFGVHEYIKDVARRFAKLGYMAVAPDLFVRAGDASKVPNIADLMKDIVGKTPDAQVMSDLDTVVTWAKQRGGDTAKLGITGFCWGGRITWLYSAHNPNVKAGVAWYGRLAGDATANSPKHPIDIAQNLKTPVLGLYGAKDTGIPLESVDRMRAALDKGNSGSAFHVYQNSGHAFHADYRPSFNEADAKDGWRRAVEWFRTHGVV